MAIATFGISLRELHASGGSAVELDFNVTVLIQVALFLFLWVALKPLLFDPMLALFKERERRTDETIERAKRIDEESALAKGRYDAAMQDVRKEAGALRDALRNEGVKRESEILSAARAEVATILDAGRKSAESERSTAKASLEKDIAVLAETLSARTLGREVKS